MKPIVVTSAIDFLVLEYDVYFCARSGADKTKECVDDLRKDGYIISAIWRMEYRDPNKYLIHFHAGEKRKEKANMLVEQQLSDQPKVPIIPKGLKKVGAKISYKS